MAVEGLGQGRVSRYMLRRDGYAPCHTVTWPPFNHVQLHTVERLGVHLDCAEGAGGLQNILQGLAALNANITTFRFEILVGMRGRER